MFKHDKLTNQKLTLAGQ